MILKEKEETRSHLEEDKVAKIPERKKGWKFAKTGGEKKRGLKRRDFEKLAHFVFQREQERRVPVVK